MLHTRSSLGILTTLCILTPAAFIACGGGDKGTAATTSGTTAETTTTTTSSSGTGGATTTSTTGSGGSGGDPNAMSETISGDVTWQVTFDATAKMAGSTDCSYTRHYEGVEDSSAKWLCPTCEKMFKATVMMTMGLQDCFMQVSMNPPAATEWIGYENGNYYRGYGGPMSQQGTAAVTAMDITTTNHVDMLMAPKGGTMQFDVSGKLTIGETKGDPNHGFVAPNMYACGWPKSNAPAYNGDYVLKKGGQMPDAVLKDKCNEPARLYDFQGQWLVVEMSARDCPPCQAMAMGEEQFVTDMKAQGIDVHVITLLAPSLADPLGDTTTTMLTQWTTKWALNSPVLADRGWGISVMSIAVDPMQVSFPTWTIVDPTLKVIDFGAGFGTWDDFKMTILANK